MNQYIVERLTKTGDGLEASCVLFNDTDKRAQSYRTNGTLANLTPQVRATFAATSDVVVDIPIGVPIDATPPTPQPPPKPTPEQEAQSLFLSNWRLYQSQARGLVAGLPVDSKTHDELQQTLISTYLPAYEALL
jgi:hypothetical protein